MKKREAHDEHIINTNLPESVWEVIKVPTLAAEKGKHRKI